MFGQGQLFQATRQLASNAIGGYVKQRQMPRRLCQINLELVELRYQTSDFPILMWNLFCQAHPGYLLCLTSTNIISLQYKLVQCILTTDTVLPVSVLTQWLEATMLTEISGLLVGGSNFVVEGHQPCRLLLIESRKMGLPNEVRVL